MRRDTVLRHPSRNIELAVCIAGQRELQLTLKPNTHIGPGRVPSGCQNRVVMASRKFAEGQEHQVVALAKFDFTAGKYIEAPWIE